MEFDTFQKRGRAKKMKGQDRMSVCVQVCVCVRCRVSGWTRSFFFSFSYPGRLLFFFYLSALLVLSWIIITIVIFHLKKNSLASYSLYISTGSLYTRYVVALQIVFFYKARPCLYPQKTFSGTLGVASLSFFLFFLSLCFFLFFWARLYSLKRNLIRRRGRGGKDIWTRVGGIIVRGCTRMGEKRDELGPADSASLGGCKTGRWKVVAKTSHGATSSYFVLARFCL